MDFTEEELKMILNCVHVTLDWAPNNLSPDFYDTINRITDKCEKGIHKESVCTSNITSTHKTYHSPDVTTSLKNIISKLAI